MPKAPPILKPAIQPGQRIKPRDREGGPRLSPSKRGYDRTWQKLRKIVLFEEPACRRCLSLGVITAATEVDHIVTIREAPHLRLDRNNLQALCKPCHSRKTASEDGGWRDKS